MSLEEKYKRIYADDLAAGLGFEWDYAAARDGDLYEALEGMCYEWDGKSWLSPERQQDAARVRASKVKRRRPKVPIEARLEDWNKGRPIR
jgi:hypothetical protein